MQSLILLNMLRFVSYNWKSFSAFTTNWSQKLNCYLSFIFWVLCKTAACFFSAERDWQHCSIQLFLLKSDMSFRMARLSIFNAATNLWISRFSDLPRSKFLLIHTTNEKMYKRTS